MGCECENDDRITRLETTLYGKPGEPQTSLISAIEKFESRSVRVERVIYTAISIVLIAFFSRVVGLVFEGGRAAGPSTITTINEETP